MVELLNKFENVSNFQLEKLLNNKNKEFIEKDFEKVTATFNVSPAIISWVINQLQHNIVPSKSICSKI